MGEMTGLGSAKQAIMHVLDETGDTKIMWNPRDRDEVETAELTFLKLRRKGFRAFRVNATGGQGEQITDFDPEAEKIILVPQLAGGDLRGDPPVIEPVTPTLVPYVTEYRLRVADHIEHAARILERRGWCRYAMCDSDGQVCILGALRRSCLDSAAAAAAVAAVEEYIALQRGDGRSMSIPTWNDGICRSKGEAVLTLLNTAKALRER